jgi:ATP-binding cassette subfamily E protein 1
LHRLPIPKPGQLLGLVGANGLGKSTALRILGAKIRPNLGKFDASPDWQDILTYFRGSDPHNYLKGTELQSYFTKILEENFKVLIKPQYIDQIPQVMREKVGTLLTVKNQRGVLEQVIEQMDLKSILDRKLEDLSGGELQRFCLALIALQKADVFVFLFCFFETSLLSSFSLLLPFVFSVTSLTRFRRSSMCASG